MIKKIISLKRPAIRAVLFFSTVKILHFIPIQLVAVFLILIKPTNASCITTALETFHQNDIFNSGNRMEVYIKKNS